MMFLGVVQISLSGSNTHLWIVCFMNIMGGGVYFLCTIGLEKFASRNSNRVMMLR